MQTHIASFSAMSFLKRIQRENLGTVLKENGFRVQDFEIVDSPASPSHERGEEVRMRGTNYYFGIYPNYSDYNYENYLVEFSPGKEISPQSEYCGNWLIVLGTFAEFLSLLKEEISAEDPWNDPGVRRTTIQTKDEVLLPAGQHFIGQRLAKIIISEATTSLDIVDPYVGTELFDRIDDAQLRIPTRILTSPQSTNSLSYFKAFKTSYPNIQLRLLEEKKLHDRFVLIDLRTGYHLGHSIKDLGKKDTQISRITDIEPHCKLFEQRWSEAKVVLR